MLANEMRKEIKTESFLDVVKTITKYHEDLMRIEEYHTQKDFASSKVDDVIATWRDPLYLETFQKLIDYIANLEDKVIAAIEAVMYVGRENDPENFVEYFNGAFRNLKVSKIGEILHIISKIPLPKYLANGLKLLA